MLNNALIHPVELGNNPMVVPRRIVSKVRPSHSLVQGAKMNDELWMAHVNSVLQHDTLPEDEVITWSVYNSRLMNDDSLKPQVLPSGRAQYALNEHHIKRTRYAHQLSVMYLHLLKHTAYSAYCSAVHGTAESQQVWAQLSGTENPQLKYWPTITELE